MGGLGVPAEGGEDGCAAFEGRDEFIGYPFVITRKNEHLDVLFDAGVGEVDGEGADAHVDEAVEDAFDSFVGDEVEGRDDDDVEGEVDFPP